MCEDDIPFLKQGSWFRNAQATTRCTYISRVYHIPYTIHIHNIISCHWWEGCRRPGTREHISTHHCSIPTGLSFNPVMLGLPGKAAWAPSWSEGRKSPAGRGPWGDGTLFFGWRTTKEDLELFFSNRRTLDATEVPDVFCRKTWWRSCCLWPQ